MDSLLTKQEIADHLKVSKMTIDRYEKRGMPVMRPEGCDPRYELEEVLKWMRGGKKSEGKK